MQPSRLRAAGEWVWQALTNTRPLTVSDGWIHARELYEARQTEVGVSWDWQWMKDHPCQTPQDPTPILRTPPEVPPETQKRQTLLWIERVWQDRPTSG